MNDKDIIRNSIESHINQLLTARLKVFNERDNTPKYSMKWRQLNSKISQNTKTISALRSRIKTISKSKSTY